MTMFQFNNKLSFDAPEDILVPNLFVLIGTNLISSD